MPGTGDAVVASERVPWSSPEGASHAGRSMPASLSGDRLLVADPTRLGPDMAVQRESSPARRRPRVITQLTNGAPPFDKTPAIVITEPMRPLADLTEPTTTAGGNSARLTQ